MLSEKREALRLVAKKLNEEILLSGRRRKALNDTFEYIENARKRGVNQVTEEEIREEKDALLRAL
jgi:hypothetical protein